MCECVLLGRAAFADRATARADRVDEDGPIK